MSRQKKLRTQKAVPNELVEILPKTVTLEENEDLDTGRIDRIPISQRKDEPIPPLSVTREIDETDGRRPKKAEADTIEHSGKEDELDTDHFGLHWNLTDKCVVDGIVDRTIKGVKTLYRVR